MFSKNEKPDSKTSSYLKKQEIATEARVSIATVDDWIASGKLPITKWADGKTGGVGIKQSDWEAFKESRVVCPVKDLTTQLQQLAVGEKRVQNGRDFRTPRNNDFSQIYGAGQIFYENHKKDFELSREIFLQPSLWKIISTIEKNLSLLLEYGHDYDDEIFTGAFLGKLIAKQINFWQTLIQPHLDKLDCLNPALVAVALPAGQGLWVRTRKQGHERNFRMGQGVYRIGNDWQAIPAPVSPEEERCLFNHRDLDLKIDKAGEPVTFEEQQRRAAEAVAKKKAAIEKLTAELASEV